MSFEQRIYTLADQHAFAAFSGDSNVMHVDPLAARRTQAGAAAVHGVHNFLWAMDQIAAARVDLNAFTSFKIDFAKFVLVGMPCHVVFELGDGTLKVEVRSGGTAALKVTAKSGPARLNPYADYTDTPAEALAEARDVPIEAMEGHSGWLTVPLGADAAALFPALTEQWGAARVEAAALTSTVVGMAIPGLHSIYSELKLQFGELGVARPGLGYHCTRIDPRFRMASVACVAAGMTAEITAFVRVPPIAMPETAALKGRLARDLAGCHALVIGGSRGLGEATAKLFAAAGAKVTITYAVGRADAEAVAADIRAACGPDAAAVLPYDTAGNAAAQLTGLAEAPSHVFYSATGRIGNRIAGGFDPAAFAGYAEFYLAAFARLCSALPSSGPIEVIWPSSVFVTERPAGMTEYAMAKAAGEVLCRDLATAFPHLAIRTPRLPRVLTDLTATVVAVETADAVAVMAAVLSGEDFGG